MKFQQETLRSNRSADFDFKKKSGLVSISERVKMVDTQNKLSIVKQCRLLKFIVAVFIIKKGKFRELENNAITRPTVF
jgi:hypothetical protein